MIISIIVAQSANGVIGRDGGLPWRLPEDLRRFKKITMGKPMIMGRATWDSIGRPLPGRTSIVLTRNPDFAADGAIVAHSAEAALAAAGDAAEVMVIGGGRVYEEWLPRAGRLYLTTIDTVVDGDTRFPALDRDEWECLHEAQFPLTAERPFAYRFEILERLPRAETD